jgi:ABC-type transporter MlaC component
LTKIIEYVYNRYLDFKGVMEKKLLESVQEKISPQKKQQIVKKFQKRLLNDTFADQLLKKLDKENLSIASSFIDTLKAFHSYLPE